MTDAVREVFNQIGGERVAGPTIARENPAVPGEVVSTTHVASADDVHAAVEAAAVAQREWMATPAPERGSILQRAAAILDSRADAAARDLTREEGKTIAEARGEVARAVNLLFFYGGEAWRLGGHEVPSSTPDTTVATQRVPLGVVGLITPWNFPIAIPTWKLAPALAAGNTAVLKPAPATGVSTLNVATALRDAGLPPGVLNVVHGDAAVGEELINDDRVAAISFTGSVLVGQHIYRLAAARRARVQLEMGGKNALVVLDDADPVKAARVAAAGGFGGTGQACTASSRVLVGKGIAAAFVEALATEAARYLPGNGLEPGVMMGPVVSAEQLKKNIEYTTIALQEGSELLTPAGSADEHLMFAPRIVTGVRPGHRIAQEEIFGPIVGVIEVDGFDEALEFCNATDYGLAAGICTTSLEYAHRFAHEAQAGVVKVNRPTTGLDLAAPFGGTKNSSTNTYREQGREAIDFYTWWKTVYLGWS